MVAIVALPVVAAQRAAAQETGQETGSSAKSAAEPAWQADLEQRRAQLVAKNGPGTDAALRTQLLSMRDTDQNARGISQGKPMHEGKLQMATNMLEIDAALTQQLKAIVTKTGWPTISLVGLDGSNAAMLVLTHTQDHAWQVSLLPQLENLADAGRIDGATLAVVIDKNLVNAGKLQRYGTQFKAVDGELAMLGVEDPGELDDRRAKVFLPPESVYKQQLAQMYHLKASNKIIMASAPAAP